MAENWLQNTLEQSLDVACIDGNVSHVACPYSTGWRTLPFAVIAQWIGGGIRFEREGRKPEVTYDGQAVLVAPGVAHCVTTPERGHVVCRWAHVRMTLFGTFDLIGQMELRSLSPASFSVYMGAILSRIGAISVETLTQLDTVVRRRALIYEIVATLLSLARNGESWTADMRGILRIAPVLDYIRNHLQDEISRDLLADMIGLKPAQFQRYFQRGDRDDSDLVREPRAASGGSIAVAGDKLDCIRSSRAVRISRSVSL